MPEARLHLYTLGRAALESIGASGSSEVVLGPGKPLALLAYLAHAPARTATRDELLDLLWAHVEPEKARATLRQTIHTLRNILGDTVLLVDGRHVRLGDGLHVDTQDFWTAIHEGDAARAIECYRGRFLPDLALPGGEGFEQWADGECARLEHAHLRAGEALVRDHLDHGHVAEAVRLARALRDDYPYRQNVWRLLLEALSGSGEMLSLRVAADDFQRLLDAEGITPEPATLACLRAARSSAEPRANGESAPLAAELVGREREFAALVSSWKASRQGTSRYLHIAAPAGLGKTRLLADFALRLRALGGEVVVVRGTPAERSVPYALAADLAESLGVLPGAAAVSPAAAQVLVSLAPSLSSHFAAGRSISSSEDTLRQRVLALSELVCAVSEERPLALLVDDLHWADPESRQVTLGLVHRLRGRSLLVTASRPAEQEIDATRDCQRLTLAPLSFDSIRALLSSLGLSLPEQETHELVSALDSASHGSPFLILQGLELAHDRGLLVRDGPVLRCTDVSALVRHVRSGDALAERVASVDSDARRVLTALAVTEMPLAPDRLALATELPPARVEDVLITLAARGLTATNGRDWEPAHDAIADAIRRLASPDERRSIHAAVGRAFAATAASVGDYRAAARHLTEAEAEPALASLFRDWIRARRRQGDRRRARELATDLLGTADAAEPRVRALVRSVAVYHRMSLGERNVLWLTAAAAASLLLSLGMMSRESSQLELIVAPLASQGTVDGHTQAFDPTPVVEHRDGRGQLIDDAGDSVALRIVSGVGRLIGPARVPLVRGRADFPRTGVRASGPILLEFATTHGHARVEVPFGGPDTLPQRPLQFISAELAGRTLDPADPELHVRPSAIVTGFVTVEYSSTFAEATIWFGATPTWGDPETSYTSFGALSTPARQRSRTERISFTAPVSPGRYYYLLLWGPESNAAFLFSGTNWTMGSPRWGDGNDVARTPSPVIEKSMRTGWLPVRLYKDFEGVRGYYVQPTAAAAIRVIVDSANRLGAAPID